jgi:hypothetical protein
MKSQYLLTEHFMAFRLTQGRFDDREPITRDRQDLVPRYCIHDSCTRISNGLDAIGTPTQLVSNQADCI